MQLVGIRAGKHFFFFFSKCSLVTLNVFLVPNDEKVVPITSEKAKMFH